MKGEGGGGEDGKTVDTQPDLRQLVSTYFEHVSMYGVKMSMSQVGCLCLST